MESCGGGHGHEPYLNGQSAAGSRDQIFDPRPLAMVGVDAGVHSFSLPVSNADLLPGLFARPHGRDG